MTRKKKAEPKPRAYSYLRFSTPEQSKGDSTRRQQVMAENYVRAHGLELDDKLTFHDLGVSAYRGKNIAAGELGAFLEAVSVGLVPQGSLLLVESLDRISREGHRAALRTLEQIVESGVDLVTLQDGKRYGLKELDDPMSWMMAFFVLVRGNEESATKSRRVSEAWHGKRLKAEKGVVLTARTPGWIRTIGDKTDPKRRYELIPERAKLIREIFRRVLKGEGLESIANSFNERRVDTFATFTGKAGYWRRSYIAKVVENRSTYGTLIPHRFEQDGKRKVRKPLDPIDGFYPAVIDEETFLIAQSTRTKDGARRVGAQVRNLLAGLARCPKCGGAMGIVNKGKKGGRVKLVCLKAKAAAGCVYRTVPYPDVEDALLAHLPYLAAHAPEGKADAGRVGSLEAERQGIQSALEALEDIIPSLAATPDLAVQMEAEREKLRARRDATDDALAEARGPLVEKKLERLLDALHALGKVPDSTEARRLVNGLLTQLFSEAVVDYEAGKVRLRWRHNGVSDFNYSAASYGFVPDVEPTKEEAKLLKPVKTVRPKKTK